MERVFNVEWHTALINDAVGQHNLLVDIIESAREFICDCDVMDGGNTLYCFVNHHWCSSICPLWPPKISPEKKQEIVNKMRETKWITETVEKPKDGTQA
jgi:hypothetical protein